MYTEDLARRTGTTPRMVRHYDRAGLLDSERLPNGYRIFGTGAVEQVRTIRRFLASGLTLHDIVTLRPCLTAEGEFDGCDQARALLHDHIARLTDEIAQQRRTLAQLKDRLSNMAVWSPAQNPQTITFSP